MSATITRTMLTIPADYLDDFRDAVVYEIEDGTNAVETARKEIRDDEYRPPAEREKRAAMHNDDRRLAIGLLAQDGKVLDQLEAAEEGEEFTVAADDATLAHVCMAMGRKVVAPRVARLLEFSPIDRKIAGLIEQELARLAWAVDNSARLTDA